MPLKFIPEPKFDYAPTEKHAAINKLLNQRNELARLLNRERETCKSLGVFTHDIDQVLKSTGHLK